MLAGCDRLHSWRDMGRRLSFHQIVGSLGLGFSGRGVLVVHFCEVHFQRAQRTCWLF
jgi:hypothetical protein